MNSNVYDIFSKVIANNQATYNVIQNHPGYYKNRTEELSPNILYPKEVPGCPGYMCDQIGNVYKPDGTLCNQFNSSGYKQVCMRSSDNDRVIKGVHQVVSMTFDEEFFDGCIVHHQDGDKHNNKIDNLEVMTPSDHAKQHLIERGGIPTRRSEPWNKGKKMSDEFRCKCSESAKHRKRSHYNTKFHSNQFVDSNGNKRTPSDEWMESFREACRRGALKRASKSKN